jgi:hypothetical protein
MVMPRQYLFPQSPGVRFPRLAFVPFGAAHSRALAKESMNRFIDSLA